MTRGAIAHLSLLDKIYALSVIVVLGGGLALWFWVGKAAEFYSKNPLFHIKITLFLVVGLVSIYPTLFFNRERKGDADEVVMVPAAVHWCLRTELLLLLAMPLLATLMARGVGLG